MKPTDLSKHNVIHVADDDLCLYDSDYSIVRITLDSTPILSNRDSAESCLLEKLKDGSYTYHNLTNLSVGDTIELAPCKYGFAPSSSASKISLAGAYLDGGGYSYNIVPMTTIDITDYNTSNISDFSYMFAECNNIIGLEKLDTSRGVNFECMFFNAFSGIDSNSTISLPVDLYNANLNEVDYLFGVDNIKGFTLDLSDAIGPKDVSYDDLGYLYNSSDMKYYVSLKSVKYKLFSRYAGGPTTITVNSNNESLIAFLAPAVYESNSNPNNISLTTKIKVIDESGNDVFATKYNEW